LIYAGDAASPIQGPSGHNGSRLLAIGLAAIFLIGVGFVQTAAGHSVLRKTGLFNPTPTYTALSFDRPNSLPQRLSSEHAIVNVMFAVQNMTGAARKYKWLILLVRNGHSDRVETGSIGVGSGATATLTRKLAVVCLGGQLRFVVQLLTPSESIDFLTACMPRKGGVS
jgi:hypothetical protein